MDETVRKHVERFLSASGITAQEIIRPPGVITRRNGHHLEIPMAPLNNYPISSD